MKTIRRLAVALLLGMVAIASSLHLVAQSSIQNPSFEVASIKQAVFPSDSAFAGYTAGAGSCGQVRLTISGSRLTLSRVSLCGLISMAYDIRDYLISPGAANWITKPDRSLVYDIQANAPEASGTLTPERAREMLQTLLADRFQLKLHREMKELSVYALVVGKNGPKLTLGPQGRCAAEAKAGRTPGVIFSFGIGMTNGQIRGGGSIASCQSKTSMAQLAVTLSRYTDRPVVDQTGLEGGHVFELQWGADDAPSDSPAPSLFTAVQEQLGLRLEATKALFDVIVIDSVQKPSEN